MSQAIWWVEYLLVMCYIFFCIFSMTLDCVYFLIFTRFHRTLTFFLWFSSYVIGICRLTFDQSNECRFYGGKIEQSMFFMMTFCWVASSWKTVNLKLFLLVLMALICCYSVFILKLSATSNIIYEIRDSVHSLCKTRYGLSNPFFVVGNIKTPSYEWKV